jgi:hypothetical protein
MSKSLKVQQWRFLVIWQIFITIFASPAIGMNPEDLKKLSYQLKNSKLTGHSSSSSSSSSMPLGSGDRIGKMEKQEEPGRTIQLGAKGGIKYILYLIQSHYIAYSPSAIKKIFCFFQISQI